MSARQPEVGHPLNALRARGIDRALFCRKATASQSDDARSAGPGAPRDHQGCSESALVRCPRAAGQVVVFEADSFGCTHVS